MADSWAREEERFFLERALRILTVREHSGQELRQKLLAKGCSPLLADHLVERCREWGYLDDRRYAERLLASAASRGWGPKRLEAELRAKGVEPGIWEELSAQGRSREEEEAEFRERALALAQRQQSKGRSLPSIYRFLAARGFTPSQIRGALEALASEFDS